MRDEFDPQYLPAIEAQVEAVPACEPEPEKLPVKLSREGRNELVVENYDFGKKLAWSFLRAWRIRLPADEVVSVVGAALTEAAVRFDPSKGVGFRTFLFYHLRGLILKEVTRSVEQTKLAHHLLEITHKYGYDYWLLYLREASRDPEEEAITDNVRNHLDKARVMLDPIEQEVVYRSVVLEIPVVDIAKDMGYCRCHVSRMKSKALNKLRGYFSAIQDHDVRALGDTPATLTKEPRSRTYKGGRGRRRRDSAQEADYSPQLMRAAG